MRIIVAIPLVLLALPGCAVDAADSGEEARASDFAVAQGSSTDPSSNSSACVNPSQLTDYVATPRGYFHSSCVFEIPAGSAVDEATGSVTTASGALSLHMSCNYPSFPFERVCSSADNPPTVNGWVEDGYKHNNGAYREFDADWTVPAKPATGGGLVYLFNGLEREDGTRIIQPVLAFNYNGTGAWAIASWNCGSGYCGHSPLQNVNPGDHIHGSILGTSCNASTGVCTWLVTTTDWTNGNTTATQVIAQVPYTWSFVTLEAYSIDSCHQYPNQNSVTMNTSLYQMGGALGTGTWNTELRGALPSCGYNVTANGYSSVTLHWTH